MASSKKGEKADKAEKHLLVRFKVVYVEIFMIILEERTNFKVIYSRSSESLRSIYSNSLKMPEYHLFSDYPHFL